MHLAQPPNRWACVSPLRVPAHGLHIGSGASGVEITLPPPIGAVPVAIGGGASDVRISRPAEVPVRLQVRGGASHLEFDEQSFGAIGGRSQLQSDGFRETPHGGPREW